MQVFANMFYSGQPNLFKIFQCKYSRPSAIKMKIVRVVGFKFRTVCLLKRPQDILVCYRCLKLHLCFCITDNLKRPYETLYSNFTRFIYLAADKSFTGKRHSLRVST